jgi:signal transduction histidine kinase/DNA-binding LacI/PurR family transcriptional regulator/AraC-like DNA-binding protein
VGLVLASLHTGASVAAWPAVADASERADVNLFCFPGGRIGLREGYEASRNSIYDLAGGAGLDGALIWASSLSGADTTESVDRFIDRYRDIPLASLSTGIVGVPVVTFDYYGGMREALTHAFTVHGYRRIAFIRGPDRHPGAQERYLAYLDGMREAGRESDPRLVSSPFPWDSGALAARELIDTRRLIPGADFEAIAASSDLMALGAVRELQSRGYRIPEDVAVFGMNNTIESRLSSPSLTTVDCPFAELGEIGLSMLLDLIERSERGEQPPKPEIKRLPTRLITRRSCGCRPRIRAEIETAASPESFDDHVRIIARAAGLSGRLERDWVRPLVEAWVSAVTGSTVAQMRFLDLFGRILDRAARMGIEIASWQNALSVLRQLPVHPCLNGVSTEAEELISQARILAAEAAERSQASRAWEIEKRDEALRDLDHELLVSFDTRDLSGILLERLPKLGIRSAFVCRYLDYGPEGRAVLTAGFRDDRLLSHEGAGAFAAVDLLPPGVFPNRRLSYVVEPLFFHDTPIGYALFEIGNRSGVVYERLRDSVSNALRGALMFERIEEAREKAIRADRVKSRLLSNVTHELRTPVDIMLGGLKRLMENQTISAPSMIAELGRIRAGAELQKRLVDDLLDLSRAELDELDLNLEPLDPGPLLYSTFELFAAQARPEVEWRIVLPDRIPRVIADEFRFRQTLMNLLGNAAKFTKKGSITMSVEAAPPELRISVADTGPGIPEDNLPFIFEPFVSIGPEGRREGDCRGAGLGLSIARHIAELHSGRIEVASEAGRGSVFTLVLPLPEEIESSQSDGDAKRGRILLVSSSQSVPPEIAAIAARRGLEVHRVEGPDDPTASGAADNVAAIAWDSSSSGHEERMLFRRLRQNPVLASRPLIVFGSTAASALVDRLHPHQIADSIVLCGPDTTSNTGPVVVADDDDRTLDSLRSLLAEAFPQSEILTASEGKEALEIICSRRPRLVVLDLVMPGLSGIDIIRHMRSDENLYTIPAILVTSKTITLDDVRAVEGKCRVVFHNKGLLSDEETAKEAVCTASGETLLPPGTSTIVKKAVAYINAHYASPLTRWQVAQSVNASEDYLSRVFRRELGLTPWEYLTRLRIQRAKELLMSGADSVAVVGARVGFPDQAYFSRVFKKITGSTPQGFREGHRQT